MWQEICRVVPITITSLQAGNQPPPTCVEQDMDVFAFQASFRALVVEIQFSITGPF